VIFSLRDTAYGLRLCISAALCAVLFTVAHASAVEERIRGVLEKTAKPSALAQITDALKETYYVAKSDNAEKLCKDLMGKRVVIAGTVEQRPGEADFILIVTKAEEYIPQLPTAPSEGGGKKETPVGTGAVPLPLPNEKSSVPEAAKTAK